MSWSRTANTHIPTIDITGIRQGGRTRRPEAGGKGAGRPAGAARTITLVVPCYNEEESLPLVAASLHRLSECAGDSLELRYMFVDDASSDSTYNELQRLFGSRPDSRIVRHEVNRGVAAAIQTGYRSATTEFVASMDADCTYDLLELPGMAAELVGGVDMVVASPYHPAGAVVGVGPMRLLLSKTLSRLYRGVLRNRLHTYTSCFRVCRTASVNRFDIEDGGFLGIAELVARLDLSGGTIHEHPAVLQTRRFGASKMKTVRTIAGHVGLLARIVRWKIRGSIGTEQSSAPQPELQSGEAPADGTTRGGRE